MHEENLIVLEIFFTFIAELVFYGAVYIVSYNTGKILIFVFTLGRYSSETFNKYAKSGWLKSSFLAPSDGKSKKHVSFNYTCNMGFAFWIVSVITFVIAK